MNGNYNILLCVFTIQGISSLPAKQDYNYASTASQIVAANLLKHNKDSQVNNVFSPIAISELLAVLAEGSEGKTYDEFVQVLGFPKEKQQLRLSFQKVLSTFSKKDDFDLEKTPSFNTWFYIYRNNTAKDEFKDVLTKYYGVTVKDISSTDCDWKTPETSILSITTDSILADETTHHNDKDLIGFETLKKLPTDDDDDEKPTKFDANIDDKEYIDANLIREQEPATTIEPQALEENAEKTVEENETIQLDEKIAAFKKVLKGDSAKVTTSDGPEKVTLSLENEEVSRAFNENARTLFKKDEIVAALSANSITGRKIGSKTKMLLFNGLYYRGNWQYPFQELRSGPKDMFFTSPTKTTMVTLMRTRGMFNYRYCKHLNTDIIELPYENERYSLLAFVPRDDVQKLSEKIEPVDLQNMRALLVPTNLFISIPKFQIEETSRSEMMLKELGLKTLFLRDSSQLSAVSEDTDLHVDELVQFTNMQVDEGAASENSISATAGKAINESDDELEIKVNKPFIFFVVDKDNTVIVSGKIMAPKYKEYTDDDIDFTKE